MSDSIIPIGTKTKCPSGTVSAVLWSGERMYLITLKNGGVALLPSSCVQPR